MTIHLMKNIKKVKASIVGKENLPSIMRRRVFYDAIPRQIPIYLPLFWL